MGGTNIVRDEILQFLLEPWASRDTALHEHLAANLGTKQMKLLNLAHDWLRSYLPHCLQKIDRVSFGIMNERDKAQALEIDPRMPLSRFKLAIPFVGKDVPSRSSEFAHPDVIIGLSILGYRYEGMRWDNFNEVMSTLTRTVRKEVGPKHRRPTSALYAKWVELAGGRMQGKLVYNEHGELALVEDAVEFGKQTHTDTQTHTHTRRHTDTHTDTHTHAHTHTDTHTHTQAPKRESSTTPTNEHFSFLPLLCFFLAPPFPFHTHTHSRFVRRGKGGDAAVDA